MDFENSTTEDKEAPKQEEAKEKPAAKPEAKKWTTEEEVEIQKIRAKRYGERMANRGLDKKIDAMILAEGLKPLTPEAERFMNKKDWEWAEREFTERKEGEKMFDRMMDVMYAFSGVSRGETKGNFKDFFETAEKIGKEKKITKDNIAEIVLEALDKAPTNPRWEKFKEGEGGKRLRDFIKDMADAAKIDDETERKNKLEKLMEKYGTEAEIRKELEEGAKNIRQLSEIAEKGEGGPKEEQQLKETQGKMRGFMDKIWATFGFVGAIGLILLVMTYLTLMGLVEKKLHIKGGK